MPPSDKIFPSIKKIPKVAQPLLTLCAVCLEEKICGHYDEELPPVKELIEELSDVPGLAGHTPAAAFCDECRLYVCKADVVLRVNGFSRPGQSES